MTAGMIIFNVLFWISFVILCMAYYIGAILIDERQSNADTKKEYLMGLILGYWWYVDIKEWLAELKVRWGELK